MSWSHRNWNLFDGSRRQANLECHARPSTFSTYRTTMFLSNAFYERKTKAPPRLAILPVFSSVISIEEMGDIFLQDGLALILHGYDHALFAAGATNSYLTARLTVLDGIAHQ